MNNIHDKLVLQGADSMDDKELVTMLLGSGSDQTETERIVEALFAECGNLGSLRRLNLSRLRMIGGMGVRRAEKIVAALELGRRVALLDSAEKRVITSNEDVVAMMRPMLQDLLHEECWAIYLTSTNGVLEQMRISQGGVQATVVDTRCVVKRALELLAPKIILVHNHPSGMAKPSAQDVALTTKIQQAAQLFDIELIDHVIVSSEGSYSFRSAGQLK
ncbi:MAG: DNA repair protein RadC [Alistipes sp.]|nr:DNA repair protein RadC [Alistipes sp.]